MNLSEPFIRRPVMTILVMSAIFFLGLAAYRFLPVSDLPNVDMPNIQVSVKYPGASPETMAKAVTSALEKEFMTIEGIDSLFSTSVSGSSTIVLQFALGRNIDDAATDVQAAISRAQPYLPKNLPNQPVYQKVNPSATPILYYAVSSPNMTLGELFDYGKSFMGERLSMIEGVSQVLTYGYPYAVRIQFDPMKLAAKEIGIHQLSEKVRSSNVDLPLGALYGEQSDFTLEADGQIQKADGYSELIIKNEKGQLVKLKNVGQALDSTQNDKFFQSFVTKEGGTSCIVLGVQRLPGMNTVQIVEAVKKRVAELTPMLPASLKIDLVYDQSVPILEKVAEVKLTLLIAFALVVLVIYLSLGKALNTLIPALTLPICVLGTFAIMFLLHFSIDVLSLLALTLCIGFLVDDAIVVLENNVRHVQEGKEPLNAALDSAKQIFLTVASMTLCLAAAFIPMLFMHGVVGKLFREFAITITVAVLFSGFVSLTLIPMLSARLVRPYAKENQSAMETFSNRFHEMLQSYYKSTLHFALKHRLTILFAGTLCVTASFMLFFLVPKDFLSTENIGFIQGYTLARDGTSPFLMHDYHKQIEKKAIHNPNVKTILSIVANKNTNEGYLFLELQKKPHKPIGKVIHELSSDLFSLVGVKTFLSPLPLIDLQVGTTATALYQYNLSSVDSQALYECAPKLLAQLKEEPMFTQVSSDLRIHQPHVSMKILRDKAANYHVSTQAIETALALAYSGGKISQINGDLSQYDVVLETLPEYYQNQEALSKLYVASASGHQVPLSELVEFQEKVGPLTINHIDGIASVGISFNLADGVVLESALKTLEKIASQTLPPQVYGKTIGTADIFKSSFASLTMLLLLTFFVIYLILGILYESFIHPLTVMSSLPPALFGGLFTLYVLDMPLSLYSFVGLILLIGIVLKNGIMMVDFALEQKEKPAEDAIFHACLMRFRPILMTTFCAMMGAVPIAFGIGDTMGGGRMSLGACMIGGLFISQPITLLLTPVLYCYFDKLQEKLRC